MSKESLSRKQQFRLLELLLIWEGNVQRKKIADTFGIALNHVTNVIREYECLCSGNLVYDQRKRRYSAGVKFKPKYCKGTPQEYLNMLKSQLYGMKDMSLSVDVLSQCIAIPEPEQGVKPSILCLLVKAILEATQIKMKYQSLKDEVPSIRIISPHHLISAGHRWHVRAFDHTREGYRDFVLHRVVDIESIHEKQMETPPDDDWFNEITLIIAPNPLASEGQRKVIAKEYGMRQKGGEWRWDVSLKRCLIPYLVKHMRLDEAGKSVSENPIVLKNKAEAEPCFFRNL